MEIVYIIILIFILGAVAWSVFTGSIIFLFKLLFYTVKYLIPIWLIYLVIKFLIYLFQSWNF